VKVHTPKHALGGVKIRNKQRLYKFKETWSKKKISMEKYVSGIEFLNNTKTIVR